jgi:hypothetical protein
MGIKNACHYCFVAFLLFITFILHILSFSSIENNKKKSLGNSNSSSINYYVTKLLCCIRRKYGYPTGCEYWEKKDWSDREEIAENIKVTYFPTKCFINTSTYC